MTIQAQWTPETHREWLIRDGAAMPRTPDCKPWCTLHAVQDDGLSTFCMGPDIRTPRTSNGYVGISHHPDEGIFIDLGSGNDSVSVDGAEDYAKAILAQVARARGLEVA
jgi:hypothetical protein